MKKYDMHTHTVNSDGTLTVEEIFEKARKIGVSGIAITDHDSIDGWKEAEKYSKKYGVEFIPGVEFSCSFQGKEIHLLGYYFKLTEILKNRFEKLKKARDERNQKIIKKLNDLGLKISLEDVKAEAKGVVSRAHIANVMLKKGYCYTKGEIFSQYLGSKGAAYVEKKDSEPIEIIKEIKKSGGVVILAHPKLITESKEELKKIIDLFKSAGLDGLELDYPLHSSEDKEFFKDIILKEKLLYSGGSDFHGKNREETELGDCFITQTELEKIKKGGTAI